jgi:cardiolipin synthase
MMHAKSSVIDGRWVRVGSTDFNPLGVAVNYELDVVVEDSQLAGQAQAMFIEDLAQSRELSIGSDGLVQPRELLRKARSKLGS